MVLRSFQRYDVTDPSVRELQYRLEETLRPITDSSIIDGILIKDVDLASGTSTKIAHKLGRTLQGWIIVGRNAAQHVYDENSGQTDLNTYLHLTAGGTVTVNIWVF
jgi:hypothetical protein